MNKLGLKITISFLLACNLFAYNDSCLKNRGPNVVAKRTVSSILDYIGRPALRIKYMGESYEIACGPTYEEGPDSSCYIERKSGVLVWVCPNDENDRRTGDISNILNSSYVKDARQTSLGSETFRESGFQLDILNRNDAVLETYDIKSGEWKLAAGPCDPSVSCNCL